MIKFIYAVFLNKNFKLDKLIPHLVTYSIFNSVYLLIVLENHCVKIINSTN